MRFLFLTPQLPYPHHSGGPLRNAGLLRGLSQAGHRLDLLTFIEAGQPDPQTTPLAAWCQTIRTIPVPQRSTRDRLRDLLLTRHADLMRRFYSDEYAAALVELLRGQHYDMIQIEGLEMAGYLPFIRVGNPAARIVYDAHNAEYALQRLIHEVDRRSLGRLPAAVYSLIQWRRLMRFEQTVCQQANQVLAVSEADAQALRRLSHHTPVKVVPNGIDTADYVRSSHTLDLGPAALVFTGTMNYRPNVDAVLWFTENVLGQICAAIPETRLFVVGNKPHERLDAIRQRKDVEVTGYVQDVAPFLHSAAVYVAPLRMGSGTRLKLLQAMAAGCAIVSTTVGAEGLDVSSGELLIADSAAAFAESVIALLRDPARRAAMGEAARQLVTARYDWAAILPCLLEIYKGMALG